MTLTRRTVLRNGGAALASLGAASQVAIAAETPPSRENTLTQDVPPPCLSAGGIPQCDRPHEAGTLGRFPVGSDALKGIFSPAANSLRQASCAAAQRGL